MRLRPYVFYMSQGARMRKHTARGQAAKSLCQNIASPAASAEFLVLIARGSHLFPFRTEQLSPVAPMVLPFVVEE